MSTAPTELSFTWLSPLAWVGRRTLDVVIYLGGLATLTGAALRSLFRPHGNPPAFFPALVQQMAGLLDMGLPMVALVHVGLGSFLSMQAYFGGTFVDGTGAVVGVGLIRNLAPLMAGLTLAGLVAARTTPELRGVLRRGEEQLLQGSGDPLRSDRRRGPDSRVESATSRLVAVRIGAALLVGPILAIWGVAVGTLVGWQVSRTLLGVPNHAFFFMFQQMIWVRDVVGLVAKALGFGFFAGVFACHEGLRESTLLDHGSVPSAACRAACWAGVAILFLNSGWFLLVYHAGPAFGPTLLAPPSF